MQPIPCLPLLAAVLAAAPDARSASGPIAHGPDHTRPNQPYQIQLAAGPLTTGTWLVDWGDGSPASSVPISQPSLSHTYSTAGIHEVKAVPRTSTGLPLDGQRSYAALVTKAGPSLYYDFNLASGTGPIGPAYTKQGAVAAITSFAGSTGNAARLTGTSYLRMIGQSMTEADFFGLEFWLRPNNLTTKQVIYAGTGTAAGNVLVYLESGKLCFELIGGGVKSIDLGADVQAGRWYHFGVSYERSPYYKERNTVRLYRDGVVRKDESYTAAQALAVNHTGATIGARDLGGGSMANHLNADIDEVVLHPLGIFPGTFKERYEAAASNTAKWRVAVGAGGSENFTVEAPVTTGDPILVELDPNPAVDNRVKIINAIAAAPNGSKLKFVTQGTQQGGGRFYLRSHNSSTWELIRLANRNNLDIDGNGAELVVVTAVCKYIVLANCHHIAIRNLSFDIDQTTYRPGAYAKIENIDPATGTLNVQYVKGAAQTADPVPSGMGLWRWRSVDGTTRVMDSGGFVPMTIPSGAANRIATPGDPSRWTYKLTNASTDAVWARLTAIQGAGKLLQVNNAHFGGSGASMWDGQHITFDRVNFHSVMGMAFLSDKMDYVRISNCRVGLPPGLSVLDRPFSSASDAFHFHSYKGGHVIFENNDIALTDDDPVSIKGGLWRNVKKKGTNTLYVGGPIPNGTRVDIVTTNLAPLSPPYSGLVTGYNSTTREVTLDTAIPGALDQTYHIINHATLTENWILRGNNIHDLNGRMMLYCGKGTMANNRISNMYSHIGYSAADWDNGGRPHDIVFNNNLFEGGSADAGPWGAWPSVPVIDDLAMAKNSSLLHFWNFDRSQRIHFTENYFEQVNQPGRGLVKLTGSTGFNATGNLHYDPVTTQFVSKDAGSTAVESANVSMPHRDNAVDVIVDNGAAVYTGTWSNSSFNAGQFFGTDYRWSHTTGATARYTPNLPSAGSYRVYAMWNNGSDRGRTAPYTVTHAGGSTTVTASQRTGGGLWVYLGTYPFNAGTGGNVLTTMTGANGLIIADAVRFQQ